MHDRRAAEEGPDFDVAVGDLIVYASHGVGRVTSRESQGKTQEQQEVVVLVFGEGLSVTLPFARALEYVRPVSTEVEIASVRETLRSAEGARDGVWQKRLRATREKVALGEAVGLAEVIRDGVRRANRSTVPGGPAQLSLTERQLYLKARKLLSEEIGAARGIAPDEADAWITEQLRDIE
jgi:CarD family transcriptional regulator